MAVVCVFQVHISQKDRTALEHYMKEIPAGSPEYLKAESALKVSSGRPSGQPGDG